ncbi:MAG: sigma-70 family RNA polymerase sigma factor [Dysgonamonadaceae bacterium]|jgi:RNA polymerase sigma-70 factor (ECF subfamily)|nr:sigma-70 family RNA polymerase sigma factor [Dysgonamonadaceae bacterium]
MSETELINKCKSGDNIARKRLYETYSRQMMAICYRYTGDKEMSEDVLHDGFIRVFVSISSFDYRGEGSLKAWISKIFVNASLEYLRKNEHIRNSSPIEEWRDVDVDVEEEIEQIPDRVLMEFISQLPEGYRTVFNMYTLEDMSHKEIGKILGINEASSRSQLSRAKSILVKKVQDYIRKHEEEE